MTYEFEELDYQTTLLGDISLRRRSEPRLEGTIVYEVKLGDEFLMSSRFTEAEVRLAELALASLDHADHPGLDVVVGGLGLGYTAAAVLDDSSVESLTVIEVMLPVIEWHRRGLVPLGTQLTADPRCTMVHADFFDMAVSVGGFHPGSAERKAHAVLVDIDHSPSHWLNPGNGALYTASGLHNLAATLHPGGVFGLWSNDPPDESFRYLLDGVFDTSDAHVVQFPNPYTGGESSNTIYLANTKKR